MKRIIGDTSSEAYGKDPQNQASGRSMRNNDFMREYASMYVAAKLIKPLRSFERNVDKSIRRIVSK